jgi:hypothetical protein
MSLLMKTKNRKLYTITGTCNGCHILIIIEVALQSVVNSLSGNPFPDRVISYGYVFILNPCNFTKFCCVLL